MTYAGSEIHRVVKGEFMQGGDLLHSHKGNDESLLGEFSDESYHHKHDEIGLIGMCKKRGYNNSSQC